MAPTKFGLFKARSRDQPEPPSTENLLLSNSSDLGTPGSPAPSTSKGVAEDLTPEDISDLHIDSDEEETSDKRTPIRRKSQSRIDDPQVHYHPLKNRPSIDATSTSTLQDEQQYEELQLQHFEDNDGASTSADCNSIQMDEMSVAPSEDMSVYCVGLKKPKKTKLREEQQLRDLRDLGMWQASNVEVMQNLLSRSGTLDEQIKWEAIATARGLCTLTDSCTCGDCKRTKYLTGISDGDGGLGAAPLFSAIMGCVLQ